MIGILTLACYSFIVKHLLLCHCLCIFSFYWQLLCLVLCRRLFLHIMWWIIYSGLMGKGDKQKKHQIVDDWALACRREGEVFYWSVMISVPDRVIWSQNAGSQQVFNTMKEGDKCQEHFLGPFMWLQPDSLVRRSRWCSAVWICCTLYSEC